MRIDLSFGGKWLALAFKNALRNRRRSLVTVAITATGTAAALLGGGFALYTYRSLAEMSARDTGHVIVAAPGQFDGTDSTPLAHGLDDADGLARKLLASPGVERVLPRVQFTGMISNGDKSEIFVGSGVDANQEFLVKGPFLKRNEGELLDSVRPQDGPGVLIGSGMARSLNAHPGTSLTLLATTTAGSLNALDVRVTGVVSTGVAELDKRLIMVDLSTAQSLLATRRVNTLHVYLEERDATDAAAASLRHDFPKLEVRTWLDQAQMYTSVKGLYDRIFGFLGVIVMVIVVFSVTNALAMAVIERTREIGTLRAMGTTPGEITRLFTLEGLVLGSGGAIAGMALAACVAMSLLMFDVRMPPPPGRTSGYPLVVMVSAQMYLTAAFIAAILSAVSSWLVSRSAARQPVVEALAHV